MKKINDINILSIIINSQDDGLGTPVTCPICKSEYNHFQNAIEKDGQDSGRANWWGRGNIIIINFKCELCSSIWSICFGFHKGTNYCFVRISGSENEEFNVLHIDD